MISKFFVADKTEAEFVAYFSTREYSIITNSKSKLFDDRSSTELQCLPTRSYRSKIAMQGLKISKLVVCDVYPIIFKLGQTYVALGGLSQQIQVATLSLLLRDG